MLHRCDVRDGEGWRGGDRTDEARERHENHGNCRSSWIAALGQHACRQSPRSSAGTAMLRFLMIEAKPENLIGDRAYDSDPLDEELRAMRIVLSTLPSARGLIATPRCSRKLHPDHARRRAGDRGSFAWRPRSASARPPLRYLSRPAYGRFR